MDNFKTKISDKEERRGEMEKKRERKSEKRSIMSYKNCFSLRKTPEIPVNFNRNQRVDKEKAR